MRFKKDFGGRGKDSERRLKVLIPSRQKKLVAWKRGLGVPALKEKQCRDGWVWRGGTKKQGKQTRGGEKKKNVGQHSSSATSGPWGRRSQKDWARGIRRGVEKEKESKTYSRRRKRTRLKGSHFSKIVSKEVLPIAVMPTPRHTRKILEEKARLPEKQIYGKRGMGGGRGRAGGMGKDIKGFSRMILGAGGNSGGLNRRKTATPSERDGAGGAAPWGGGKRPRVQKKGKAKLDDWG